MRQPDIFEQLDRKVVQQKREIWFHSSVSCLQGGKEAYAKLAAKVSAKLLESQNDLHFMHLVTELAKNLCKEKYLCFAFFIRCFRHCIDCGADC